MVARLSRGNIMVEFRDLGKWGKRGQMLSLLLVWSFVIYALVLYSSGGERDRNLVYTAMFMDDLAVDLYRTNASYDAVVYAASMAGQFCDLYDLEIRTLDKHRYAPLCEAISTRRSLLLICASSEYGCEEEQIQRLESMLEEAEPIAKELKDNPPYYGYILSYDPIQTRTQYGEPIKIIG